MSTFIQKFRFLFLPVIGATLCGAAISNLVAWLLLIQFHLFTVPEVCAAALLPATLPIPVVYLLLKKQRAVIPDTGGRNSPDINFWVILWLLSGIPAATGWQFVDAASGKLTQLDKISSIDTQHLTKYYSVKQVYIDMPHARTFYYQNQTSKKSDIDFYCYVAVPMYDDTTMRQPPPAWLGLTYHGQCSRNENDSTRGAQWNAFIEKYATGIQDKLPPSFVYFEAIGINDDHDNFNKLIDSSGHSNSIVLDPVNSQFKDRFNMNMLMVCSIVWGVIVLILIIFIAAVPMELEPNPYKKMF